LDDTLVLFTTEFGRTPFTQSAADQVGKGRDHNQYGFSVWLAGAGLRHGVAFGATDDVGWKAVENRVTWPDFHATVLHLLGIDHTRLTFLSQWHSASADQRARRGRSPEFWRDDQELSRIVAGHDSARGLHVFAGTLRRLNQLPIRLVAQPLIQLQVDILWTKMHRSIGKRQSWHRWGVGCRRLRPHRPTD